MEVNATTPTPSPANRARAAVAAWAIRAGLHMEGKKGTNRVAEVCSLCEEAMREQGRNEVLTQGAETLEEAVRVIDEHRGAITADGSASAIRKELTAAIRAFLLCLRQGTADPHAQAQTGDARCDLDDTSAANPDAPVASDPHGPQALAPKVEGVEDEVPCPTLSKECSPVPAVPPVGSTENLPARQAQDTHVDTL